MSNQFYQIRNLSRKNFITILPGFLKEIQEDFINLQAAQEKQELDSIGKIAHKIKGTSKGYGANSISEIALTIELSIKQDTTRFLNENIKKLQLQIKKGIKIAKKEFNVSIDISERDF